MSGIEVMGVILGAFPLLLAAFEHRKDFVKAKNMLLEWNMEYGKCLADVKDEQLLFRQNMIMLLCPLANEDVILDEKLESLLADPGGTGWCVEDIKTALQGRLGDASERYLELMQEINLALMRILKSLWFGTPASQEKLHLEQGSEPSTDNVSSARKLMLTANREFLHRKDQLTFCLKRSGMEEAVEEVRSKRERLQSLLYNCNKTAKLQHSLTSFLSRRASQSLLQYWQHAGRIYALVQATWVCSCRKNHCANLLLHHPTSKLNELNLQVLWASNAVSASCEAPWKSQGLHITWSNDALRERLVNPLVSTADASDSKGVFDKTPAICNRTKRVRILAAGPVTDSSMNTVNSQDPSVASEPELFSTHEQRKSSFFTAAARKFKKRARFTDEPDTTDANAMASAAQSQPLTSGSVPGPVTPPSLSAPGTIMNICEAMAGFGIAPAHLGALVDPSGSHQYLVCARPSPGLPSTEISLYDIFHLKEGRRRILRSDRFRIALLIASSHLQLHSTPWARQQWQAIDVLFRQDAEKPERIDFENPFVSADFNDTLPENEQISQITDRSFACLGIMLLELIFEYPLEHHNMWHMDAFAGRECDPMIRVMIAISWAEDVELEAGPEVAASISWCLRHSPKTLKGEQWRKDLAERVVLPLQHYYNMIKPIEAG